MIGAGRSTQYLISYLIDNAEKENWLVTIGDLNLSWAEAKAGNSKYAKAIELDLFDEEQLKAEIFKNDVVVSLAPAHLHIHIAKQCLSLKKSLFTASYVNDELAKMNQDVADAGLLFMNEAGLDPGIDHMSAMEIFERIKSDGGKITGFKSYAGGLVAPESDDNPWKYKFSWNPRNIILAGSGGPAKYLSKGKLHILPYQRLYREAELVEIKGIGTFAAYLNRDSVSYQKIYTLDDIEILQRLTLRYPEFVFGWQAVVALGINDDSYKINFRTQDTPSDFLEIFLPTTSGDAKSRLSTYLLNDADFKKHKNLILSQFEFVGFFDSKVAMNLEGAFSPAEVLQKILEPKLALAPADKDYIVMYHEVDYIINHKKYKLTSSFKLKGENEHKTAMAKTVGLPVAILLHAYLDGKLNFTGVRIPTMPEAYKVCLDKLKDYGIYFEETVEELSI